MVAKVKKLREKVKAIQYTMNYSDFDESRGGQRWCEAIWDLFNAKNTWGADIQIDVRQHGRDANGFYENYISLIVFGKSNFDWDYYLNRLGYGYKKQEITVLKIIARWDEDLDEVIAEFDV